MNDPNSKAPPGIAPAAAEAQTRIPVSGAKNAEAVERAQRAVTGAASTYLTQRTGAHGHISQLMQAAATASGRHTESEAATIALFAGSSASVDGALIKGRLADRSDAGQGLPLSNVAESVSYHLDFVAFTIEALRKPHFPFHNEIAVASYSLGIYSDITRGASPVGNIVSIGVDLSADRIGWAIGCLTLKLAESRIPGARGFALGLAVGGLSYIGVEKASTYLASPARNLADQVVSSVNQAFQNDVRLLDENIRNLYQTVPAPYR